MMPPTSVAPVLGPPIASAMGPFTMDDDVGPGEPHPLLGSAVGFAAASSMFGSGCYGGGVHRARRARATVSPQPHRTTSSGHAEPHTSSRDASASYTSATHIYGYGGGGGSAAHGFSHSSLYGTPSTMQDVAYGYAGSAAGGFGGGAAMFTVPQFGGTERSTSEFTAGTALSDCHLSRKDDGGFTPDSTYTFMRSHGSFVGPISGDSPPSLHDGALVPGTAKSGVLRDSTESTVYPDGASHLAEPQRRLSSSGRSMLRNAAVGLSTEGSFSATLRSGNARRQTSPQPAVHVPSSTQPPQQRPHLAASQSGAAHHSPATAVAPRPSPNADALLAAAANTTAATDESGEAGVGGFGPMGCSPLYDLDAVLGDLNDDSGLVRAAQTAVAEVPVAVTDTRRAVSSRRGYRARRLSTRSITSSLGSGPRSAAGSACSSSRGTRPPFSRLTSPDQADLRPTEHAAAEALKPRRTNPRRLVAAAETTTAAAAPGSRGSKSPLEAPFASSTSSTADAAPRAGSSRAEEQPHKLSGSFSLTSIGPVRPGSRSRKTSASCTIVPPTAVRKPQPPALGATMGSGTSSNGCTPSLTLSEGPALPSKTPTAFTVAPPSQRERQAAAFQRRRYLESACAPLTASDMLLPHVPPSPPHRRSARVSTEGGSESPNAAGKLASSLPRSDLLLLSTSATTQPRSPHAAGNSTCSSSIGTDRLSALGSGTGVRRGQARCGAAAGGSLAGFHPALHMESLNPAAENSNEKSVRSLGGRSTVEWHGLQESGNGLASRSCPSMECSTDDMGNPFLTRRSSSWSVHSARSTTESGENPTATVRRRRLAERALPTTDELEEEHIMTYVLAIR